MLRPSLSRKLFFALAAMLVAMLLIFAGFSRWGLQRSLGPFVAEIELRRMDGLAEILRQRYAADGGWGGLRADPQAWFRVQMQAFEPPGWRREGEGPERGGMRSAPPDANAGPPGPSSGAPGAAAPQDGRTPPPAEGRFGAPPPRFIEGRPPPDLLPFGPQPGPPGSAFGHGDGSSPVFARLGLVDAGGAYVAGRRVDSQSAARLPVRDGERLLGTLLLQPLDGLGSDADRAFLAQQSRFVIWTGGAGLLVALALSWFLARRWLAPVDALTEGASRLARGRLDTRVPVRGNDEMTLLTRTFNEMAEKLDTIESSRREWLADVAHELRTPLAAMRAEIEALQDGVRAFDDRTALRLHRQVMRLGQLVDDLRGSLPGVEADALARSSTHTERAPMPALPALAVYPLQLLVEACGLMRERFAAAGVGLDLQAVEALSREHLPQSAGDPLRLHQVFLNLLENSLRYTDAGGLLRIAASIEPIDGLGDSPADTTDEAPRHALRIDFDDSAPGVAPSDLPRLFERFFRAEASRHRSTGGSGLGLSICRAAVEAQGGRIEAEPSPLGGLRVRLLLPLQGVNA